MTGYFGPFADHRHSATHLITARVSRFVVWYSRWTAVNWKDINETILITSRWSFDIIVPGGSFGSWKRTPLAPVADASVHR